MKEVTQDHINSAEGLAATDPGGAKVRLKDVALQTYDEILKLKPIMVDQHQATTALLGATKILTAVIKENNSLLRDVLEENRKHREIMQQESNPALRALTEKLK